MRLLFSIVFGLAGVLICHAQTNQTTPPQPGPSITMKQVVELPAPKRGSFRPGLSLQAALKLAETYIAKQRINIAPYYLFEARYVLYGSKDNQDPSWFFWWVKEDGVIGDYVYIVVSIKTKNVFHPPSM